MATNTMTTAAIAEALETTPRELRKFLRAEGAGVGKGSRYALPGTKRELNSLQKRFNAWNDAKNAKQDEVQESDETVEED
jgi:CO/xanthine dehydrogenase Mo-binding subunit